MALTRKDISRDINALRHRLPAPFPDDVPSYMHGVQWFTLPDGTVMGLRNAQIREIQKLLFDYDHGKLVWDRPLIAAGCLFLPSMA